MANTFRCALVTPEEQLLDEEVTAAVLPAHDGQVGVLPSRSPLLVQLGSGLLRLDYVEGGSRHFFVNGGFAQMKGNRLSLLTDEAKPAENIILNEAEAAFAEAKDRTFRSDDEFDKRQRDLERARGMVKLHGQFDNKL